MKTAGGYQSAQEPTARRRPNRKTIWISVIAAVLIVALLTGGLLAYFNRCESLYQEAAALRDAGDYAAAQELFESKLIANYRDARAQAAFCLDTMAYQAAQELLAARDYQQAGEAFAAIGAFSDAEALSRFCADMVQGMALYEEKNWAEAYECFSRYEDEDAREWAQRCIQTDIPAAVWYIPDKYRTRGVGGMDITNYLGSDVYFEIYSVTNDELVLGIYMKPNQWKYFNYGLKTGQYRFVLYTGPAWFGIEQKFGAGRNGVFARELAILENDRQDEQADIRITGTDLCTVGIYETYIKLQKY